MFDWEFNSGKMNKAFSLVYTQQRQSTNEKLLNN